MKVKEMKVEPCRVQEVRQFIEHWHYSNKVNGIICDYCFKLTYDGKIIGAAIFGGLAMPNVWMKYADKREDIIELRRLCCIDDTPKNTESYFIGQCLRWLKRNTDIKKVISYADTDYGHTGIIYKASNFDYIGKTNPGRVIVYQGKIYHDKCIRTRYKGKLKPFAQRIKKALDSGEAYYKKTGGKHIYIYDLDKRRK